MTSFSHGYARRLDDTSAPSWGGDLMDTQSILAHVDRLIASKRGEWESRIQLAASEVSHFAALKIAPYWAPELRQQS